MLNVDAVNFLCVAMYILIEKRCTEDANMM